MSENNVPKKRGRKPKNKDTEISQVNNQPQVKTISLAKADNTQDILNAISNVRMYEMDEVLNQKRMQQPLQKKEKTIIKNVFMETNKPRDKEVVSNFVNNQSNEDFFGINND